MRTIWISLGLLLAATPEARANWEYSSWGMTPEQVARASNGAVKVIPAKERSKVSVADMEEAAEGTHKDGDLLLDVRFSFDTKTGGLVCVAYAVHDAAQNALLKDTLIARYGPPQEDSSLPAIGMQSVAWTKADRIDLTSMPNERAFVLHCNE